MLFYSNQSVDCITGANKFKPGLQNPVPLCLLYDLDCIQILAGDVQSKTTIQDKLQCIVGKLACESVH